jgi:N6-adenosine-specific RNA methylase IME4
MSHTFASLELGTYGAILADPPARFQTYSRTVEVFSTARKGKTTPTAHYRTMSFEELTALPVGDLAAKDSVLFLWATWPLIKQSFDLIEAWGFAYKTCAFAWMKSKKSEPVPIWGCGFWTRANTEFCLLATRGRPKRLHRDVPQAIFEPRREHSRKPDIYDRIERLVAGPYVELFARQQRTGWDSWGDQLTKFNPVSEFRGSRSAAEKAGAPFRAPADINGRR